MTTTPKIKGAQFAVTTFKPWPAGNGGTTVQRVSPNIKPAIEAGWYLQNENMNTTVKKHNANTFVTIPNAPFPTGYFEGKSGWWVNLRQSRQLMQVM